MAINTTQQAPLERLLANARSKKVIPYIRNKNVLDFGCGIKAWNANAIYKHCKSIIGVEENYSRPQLVGKVNVYPSLGHISDQHKFDVILALAVFEHIDPFILIEILNSMSTICASNAILVGTVPTPQARPILEFISYRLRLIDESQIRDHKVYYDVFWLSAIVEKTAWKLSSYNRFQLGMNSHFILKPRYFKDHSQNQK
jgi:SAM-dependent methyltransferase